MVKYIIENFLHQEPGNEAEEKGETFYSLKAIIDASLMNREGVKDEKRGPIRSFSKVKKKKKGIGPP
jgi:hypothetical protein